MSKKKHPHHHGNLREALILAGMAIVDTEGPDALTLRKCALHAGVSHAAPAHHFNGLISLKTAIIARGHQIFAQTMRDASITAAQTATAQVFGICQGYINFANTHNALFKFMFQQHDVDFSLIDATTLAEINKEAAASYQILRTACTPFGATETERINAEIMVWSLVHGYAMLFGGKNYTPRPQSTNEPTKIPPISDLLPFLHLKIPSQNSKTSL